ncbi:unnamed protein product, partial [Medioppia subpectinata]
MWEYALCRDVIERTFDDDGTCMPPNQTFRQGSLKDVVRIDWDLSSQELKRKINSALTSARKSNQDLDLVVFDHKDWGKG